MTSYEYKASEATVYPNLNQQQQGTHVVIQQPVATTTTTIITQQPGQGMREWSSGMCDCFQDIKSCCCAVWFGNCYYACIATRMGENCCVGFSGYTGGCVPGGHLAMRSRFRGSHGIRGDICGDCCITSCCLPCSMCQLSREMDALGYPQGCC